MTTTDTRQLIMDAARKRVQNRGYGSLSFRELAQEVGIKSASVHYHFPTKGDLATALAQRYTEEATGYFDQFLAASQDAGTRIRNYTAVFRAALENDNRMCLCGIMSAERDELPVEVRAEVDRFTDVNVRWLGQVLSQAKPDAGTDAIRRQALAIFAAIGGAQLVARGRGDIALFDEAIESYRAVGLLP